MSFKSRALHEIKSIFWTFLYFLCWFGALMLIKVLLLEEYKVEFYGVSMVVLGSFIVTKVVLILEGVSLGAWTKNRPVILEILFRTLLYLLGVFIVLLLEKSFEARHEYGGFTNAMKALLGSAELYHILVSTIAVFGALLGFNLWSVFKKYLGEKNVKDIFLSPPPNEI